MFPPRRQVCSVCFLSFKSLGVFFAALFCVPSVQACVFCVFVDFQKSRCVFCNFICVPSVQACFWGVFLSFKSLGLQLDFVFPLCKQVLSVCFLSFKSIGVCVCFFNFILCSLRAGSFCPVCFLFEFQSLGVCVCESFAILCCVPSVQGGICCCVP